MAQWRNWSGSVEAHPASIARPHTEAELSALVAAAQAVRVTGAGHSFMPLCATDGLLLDLADLEGEIVVAPDRKTADCPAGWSLAKLTEALWAQGLSLSNQGDVNPQSLAGAISTGTHGTGKELGSLATFAQAFRLVLADGSVTECDAEREPELYQAARLSLGLLGVMTRITIDVLPAFHLEERVERRPLAEVYERFDDWAAQRRHIEFFVFPYADQVILKSLHEVPAEGEFKPGMDIDEAAFRLACETGARLPASIPAAQKLMMAASGKATRRVGPAWRIFPSERTIPFEEMEYEVPRANGLDALKASIARIRNKSLPVTFPFEFRWVAADDIALSPFHAGPCASISMHQFAPMPYAPVFAEVEPILREAGGRPHWAKRHTLTERDVHALYPRAKEFLAVRDRVDPTAKFANQLLRTLFGITPQVQRIAAVG
ncbi:L-gulono-1,4-lactone dehydrogenase [soil metagenome]